MRIARLLDGIAPSACSGMAAAAVQPLAGGVVLPPPLTVRPYAATRQCRVLAIHRAGSRRAKRARCPAYHHRKVIPSRYLCLSVSSATGASEPNTNHRPILRAMRAHVNSPSGPDGCPARHKLGAIVSAGPAVRPDRSYDHNPHKFASGPNTGSDAAGSKCRRCLVFAIR